MVVEFQFRDLCFSLFHVLKTLSSNTFAVSSTLFRGNHRGGGGAPLKDLGYVNIDYFSQQFYLLLLFYLLKRLPSIKSS